MKPHADLFFPKLFILNDVDLKQKLVKNNDNLVFMTPQNSSFKIKILNASFFVRKMKIVVVLY